MAKTSRHSPPFLHYGCRLTPQQVNFLKNVPNASAFIRSAINEKIRKFQRHREMTLVKEIVIEETVMTLEIVAVPLKPSESAKQDEPWFFNRGY